MTALTVSACAPASFDAGTVAPPATTDRAAAAEVAEAGAPRVSLLFFGLSSQDGHGVSEQQWRSFLERDVRPRVAAFTELEAHGHYDSTAQGAVEEGSRLLLIVHPMDTRRDRDLTAIVERYKERFAQESVLWLDWPATIRGEEP